MRDDNTLSHTTYNCKYHIVIIPKYRRMVIYRKLRKHELWFDMEEGEERGNFSGMNLSNRNFLTRDLRFAILDSANLNGTILNERSYSLLPSKIKEKIC